MDIYDVFTAVLSIVGGAFLDGWEVLFDIDVYWFFNMTFGDIVVASIGVSMAMSVFLDFIGAGGQVGHSRFNRLKRGIRTQGNKDRAFNAKVKARELASQKKRGF